MIESNFIQYAADLIVVLRQAGLYKVGCTLLIVNGIEVRFIEMAAGREFISILFKRFSFYVIGVKEAIVECKVFYVKDRYKMMSHF